MVKERKKHGRRVLCIFTAVIAAVSMLCFAGCDSKSTEEKTVSGIITVIADGKYTLQPGTIESIENQFPGGMNDGSRRDGSAPAAPNNNGKISDNDGAEPADSGAKDTNTNDRNDTGKQSEGNPPEGNPPEGNPPEVNPPEGNPGSGMNPGGSKISFTENGEAAIEFTVGCIYCERHGIRFGGQTCSRQHCDSSIERKKRGAGDDNLQRRGGRCGCSDSERSERAKKYSGSEHTDGEQ